MGIRRRGRGRRPPRPAIALKNSRTTGSNALKVAAIGDLHVKDDGAVSYKDLFGQISRAADVLVIAGDLTDLGKPREAEILAEDLRACSIPVVAVLGNHDYE